jgi:regulator of protease activity HflC (stomatin/prohibitin superfamily)
VTVNLEFSYRFDADRVAETFVQFKGRSGEAIKDTFIKPKIVAWTQEISANYPVTDIFGDKRTAINAELDSYLREKFEPYGIIIDTVNFTDISVDDETAAAIQEKVTAQQKLELAKIEAETALINANKDKEVAEIEAEKILIAAEAEAEANRKISESLTEELIEQQKLDKWNGELPQIVSDGTIIKDFSPNGN